MLELIPDVIGVGHGILIAGERQRRTHEGLIERLQECLGNRMIRHPQANGLSLRLHQPFRHIPGRLQYERVGTGRSMAQQPIGGVIYPGIGPEFRQIAAHQCEVMIVPQRAYAPDPLHRLFITKLAPQSVG